MFDHALDHVSASNWESLTVGVTLAESTGTEPLPGSGSLAVALASGMVEVGGIDRKTLQGQTVTASGSTRVCHADNVVWDIVGVGQTVIGAVAYLEGADDTLRIPLLWLPCTPTPTTGGRFTLQWPNGLISFERKLL